MTENTYKIFILLSKNSVKMRVLTHARGARRRYDNGIRINVCNCFLSLAMFIQKLTSVTVCYFVKKIICRT